MGGRRKIMMEGRYSRFPYNERDGEHAALLWQITAHRRCLFPFVHPQRSVALLRVDFFIDS